MDLSEVEMRQNSLCKIHNHRRTLKNARDLAEPNLGRAGEKPQNTRARRNTA
jgi:hypothetical protein